MKMPWARRLLVGVVCLFVLCAQIIPSPAVLAQGGGFIPGGTPGGSNTAPANPDEEPETKCAVGIIGWLICGVSFLIAKLLDGSFRVLEILLYVKPLDLSTSGGKRLYQIWDMLRSVANVSFVILLLVVIASHISSIGLSNYNIKRMLPRLIVSIILVNVSLYIGLLIIDLANILGRGLYEVFIELARLINVPIDIKIGGGAVVILGALALGALLFIFATSLIGMLGTALVSICIVILYLVARQAILITLVVISPIAFALNVLPGTQKWFSKWWSALLSSAMVYPVIGLIFGGSVVAAGIIRVSPVSGIPGGEGVAALLGLAAQVLPFSLVPKFMKMSGGIMSKVNSIVNKPDAGVFGAIRKGSSGFGRRMELQRQINNLNNGRKYSPYTIVNRSRASLASKSRSQKRQMQRGDSNTGSTAYDDFYSKNASKIIKKGLSGLPPGALRDKRKAALLDAAEQSTLQLAITDVDVEKVELDMEGANLDTLRHEAFGSSKSLSDPRRIAAISKLAAQDNIAELHSILEMIQQEGGGNEVLYHALADAIEESGMPDGASHLTGSGLESIRNGDAFKNSNVVGGLYERATGAGKLSAEGLSKQSSGSLVELERYKNALSDKTQEKLKHNAQTLDSNQRLHLNMSGSGRRAAERIANW